MRRPIIVHDPLFDGTTLGAPDSTGLATATGSNASPTQGSSGNTNTSGSSSGKKSTNIVAIVGGAVGGVVGLIAIGLAIFFWMRHRRNAARDAPTGPLDLTAGEHGHYVEKPFEPEAMAAPLPSPKLYVSCRSISGFRSDLTPLCRIRTIRAHSLLAWTIKLLRSVDLQPWRARYIRLCPTHILGLADTSHTAVPARIQPTRVFRSYNVVKGGRHHIGDNFFFGL